MQVNSKEMMPEDLINVRIENLPPKYQDPIYICPNSIQLNIYSSKVTIQNPIDLNILVDTCDILERIYLNMYPGGSAMEVLQFKKIYDPALKNRWKRAKWIPQYFIEGQKGNLYIKFCN